MKAVSYWAKQHIWIARLFLILIQISLAIYAFLIGAFLFDSAYLSSNLLQTVGLGIFFFGLIFYPIKNTRIRFFQWTYLRQKICDTVLAISTLFLFSGFGHQFMQVDTKTPEATTWRTELIVHKTIVNESPKAFKKAKRKAKRIQRKQARKKLKASIKQMKNGLTGGEKAALIVLTLLLGTALLYGVAALACSLSCSGMDVLAGIVGIGGAILIIVLAVLAIRKISGKNRKMQEL